MSPSLIARHPELRADTADDLVRTRAKTFYDHPYVQLTKFHLAASKKGELVEKLAAYPLHHTTRRCTQLPFNATHIRLNNNCVCNTQLLTHSHIIELEHTNQAHDVNCYGLSSVQYRSSMYRSLFKWQWNRRWECSSHFLLLQMRKLTITVTCRRRALSSEAAFTLYKRFVRPLMEYVCPIWGSVARIDVVKLTVLKWRLTHFGMLALRKFTKMWKFRF